MSVDFPFDYDVSVIVVNYKTGHLLEEALGCLRAASARLSVQTILVDNASKDGSVELIARAFPEARLIVNEANVGFGRANNQALRYARGRYVLLLNTDAFMEPDALRKAVAFMDANPRCGVLGVKLLGRDGSPQPSARRFPTPWSAFLTRTGLRSWIRRPQGASDRYGDLASPTLCDWVPGCFYLVRRAVIDEVGLFDERYFLYYEEVDHCMAAGRAGWDVVCYPETSVVHIGGESAKSEGALTAGGRQLEPLQLESELLFFRKNYGLAAMLFGAALHLVADVIEVLKRVVRGQPLDLAGSWRHAALVGSLLARTHFGVQPTR